MPTIIDNINLKQASKTINFLTEHKINSYEELEQKVAELHNSFDDTVANLKEPKIS